MARLSEPTPIGPAVKAASPIRRTASLAPGILNPGFGLGISIPGERPYPGNGNAKDHRSGEFLAWYPQPAVTLRGLDGTGLRAVDAILRQPRFCFDDYGERVRLAAELLRDPEPVDLELLLAGTTEAGPMRHPARTEDHGMRLLIGLDHTGRAPASASALDPAIGIGVDWCDYSPEPVHLELLSPHAHAVRMLIATLHQRGLICFDFADLRSIVLASEGYARYWHFAGRLGRLDEMVTALRHPALLPVWRSRRSLLMLISSGHSVSLSDLSTLTEAVADYVPESACRASTMALYAERPEAPCGDWVWVDVLAG